MGVGSGKKVFSAKQIMWNSSLGPPARGCGPELPWIHVGAHTGALGQRVGVMGSGKAGLDGAEDGTCLNRCWSVSVWPHMPALNRRVPPPSTPFSHPKMSVPPLNLRKLPRLRGSGEEIYAYPSEALGLLDNEPP